MRRRVLRIRPCGVGQRVPQLRLVRVVREQVHRADLGLPHGPLEAVVFVETQVVALLRKTLRGLAVDVHEDVVVEPVEVEHAAPRAAGGRRRRRILHEPMQHRQPRGVAALRRDGAVVLIGVRAGDAIEVDKERIGRGRAGHIHGDDAPAEHFAWRESGGGDLRGVDLVAGQHVGRDAIVEHRDECLRLPHPAVGELHGRDWVQRLHDLCRDRDRRAPRAADRADGVVRRVGNVRPERGEARAVGRARRGRDEVAGRPVRGGQPVQQRTQQDIRVAHRVVEHLEREHVCARLDRARRDGKRGHPRAPRIVRGGRGAVPERRHRRVERPDGRAIDPRRVAVAKTHREPRAAERAHIGDRERNAHEGRGIHPGHAAQRRRDVRRIHARRAEKRRSHHRVRAAGDLRDFSRGEQAVVKAHVIHQPRVTLPIGVE